MGSLHHGLQMCCNEQLYKVIVSFLKVLCARCTIVVAAVCIFVDMQMGIFCSSLRCDQLLFVKIPIHSQSLLTSSCLLLILWWWVLFCTMLKGFGRTDWHTPQSFWIVVWITCASLGWCKERRPPTNLAALSSPILPFPLLTKTCARTHTLFLLPLQRSIHPVAGGTCIRG